MRWVIGLAVLLTLGFIIERLGVPLWLTLVLEVFAITAAFTAMMAYDVLVGRKQPPRQD
jgi:heme A synthase